MRLLQVYMNLQNNRQVCRRRGQQVTNHGGKKKLTTWFKRKTWTYLKWLNTKTEEKDKQVYTETKKQVCSFLRYTKNTRKDSTQLQIISPELWNKHTNLPQKTTPEYLRNSPMKQIQVQGEMIDGKRSTKGISKLNIHHQ